MRDAVRGFYDDLAVDYHLLFPDWRASSARQAAALDAVVTTELGALPPGAKARHVLDAAAGVGTQLLGLAALGVPLHRQRPLGGSPDVPDQRRASATCRSPAWWRATCAPCLSPTPRSTS